jgi:hypothetical protein
MMTTIDYMNEFLTTAINQYKNTLYFARDNQINNDAVLTSQDRLLNLAYDAGNLLLDLADEAALQRDLFGALSDSTGLPKYQLGIVYFDDQRSILQDYAKNALVASYDASKDLEVNNIWTNLILAKLIEIDPAQYLGDVPKQIINLMSDNSWKVSSEYLMDWVTPELDDSMWEKVVTVDLPVGISFPGYDAIQNTVSIWQGQGTIVDSLMTVPSPDSIDLADSTIISSGIDTTTVTRSLELEDKESFEDAFGVASSRLEVDSSFVSTEPDTVTLYFRKNFSLPDRTINGYAFITADDDYHFYLNGQYIKADEGKNFVSVDQIDYIEIGDFLKVGENVISIDVTDYDGPPRNGLRFFMELELLPVEISSAAERVRQRAEESVDPERLKTVTTLNKNRVISQ